MQTHAARPTMKGAMRNQQAASKRTCPVCGFRNCSSPDCEKTNAIRNGRLSRKERWVLWPDTHCGSEDKRAVGLALKVMEKLEPTGVVLLGDFLDFHGIARFDLDRAQKSALLQTEVDIGKSVLRSIRDASPLATSRRFIEGNHEARLTKWVWGNPAFRGMEALSIPSLLSMSDSGFEPTLHKSLTLTPAFVVKHGTYIASDAGQSGKKEMQRAGMSGASGHTHRIGTFFLRTESGLSSWTECGHLQSNPPSWAPIQNWQQGLAYVDVDKTGSGFSVQLVPFRLSYTAIVEGQEVREREARKPTP